MFQSNIKGRPGAWCVTLNNIAVASITTALCERLTRVLDVNAKTGKRIENWHVDTGADAVTLRLCGVLYSIVISNPKDYTDEINTYSTYRYTPSNSAFT